MEMLKIGEFYINTADISRIKDYGKEKGMAIWFSGVAESMPVTAKEAKGVRAWLFNLHDGKVVDYS